MFNEIRAVRRDAIKEIDQAKKLLQRIDPKKDRTETEGNAIFAALHALQRIKNRHEKCGNGLINRVVRFLVCSITMHKVNKVSRELFECQYITISKQLEGVEAFFEALKKNYKGRDQSAFEKDLRDLQSAFEKLKKPYHEICAAAVFKVFIPRETGAITQEEADRREKQFDERLDKKQIGFKEKFEKLLEGHFPGLLMEIPQFFKRSTATNP